MNAGKSAKSFVKKPFIIFVLLLSPRIEGSQNINLQLRDVPENWIVELDISSVESIIINPERILKNTETFLER